MCETWDRIHMWIGIVLVPFQVRGINMEIRIQIRIGINTMPVHNIGM
jgi:hypothetical protein